MKRMTSSLLALLLALSMLIGMVPAALAVDVTDTSETTVSAATEVRSTEEEISTGSVIVARIGTSEYTELATALNELTAESHTLELADQTVWSESTPVYWASGAQSAYAATLADALKAAYMAGTDDIKIVCRPGADVGFMTHGHVADNLTIYGNNAYISDGEYDLEVDTYAFNRETGVQIDDKVATSDQYLDKDITIKAYELDNLSVWGQRHTTHKISVNLTDCDGKAIEDKTNVQRVYISGATGDVDITLTGCEFITNNTSVYSNANGTIEIDNCSFTRTKVPVNFNHKADGQQTLTVENCTFTGCGDEGEWKQFAAPVRFVNSGSGKQTASVNTCKFEQTVGNNGDILIGDGRTSEKSNNNVSLTVTGTKAKVMAQQPGYYNGTDTDTTKGAAKKVNGEELTTTIDNVISDSTEPSEPTAYVTVNGDETKKYTTLDEAIATAEPVGGAITYTIHGTINVAKETTGEYSTYPLVASGSTATTINFVGAGTDAEIRIADDKTVLSSENSNVDVNWSNLTLSREKCGKFVTGAQRGPVYFTVWADSGKTVSYTNCKFPNGAHNNWYGNTNYTKCSFTNPSGEYGLWVQQATVAKTIVTDCSFTGTRGVKVYDTQGSSNHLEIKNTEFKSLTEKAAIVVSKPANVVLENVSASDCTQGLFQKALESATEKVTFTANGTGISGSFNITDDKTVAAAKDEFNISAGTFTSEVSSDYCADGFEVKKSEDDTTWGVAAKSTAVASYNGTEYDTLQAAIDAASQRNGGQTEVKLLTDVTITETVVFAKKFDAGSVLLNLGGFTLTGNGCRAIQVNKGNLYLENGTVTSTGIIDSSSVIRIGSNEEAYSGVSAMLYMRKGAKVLVPVSYGVTIFGSKTFSEELTVAGNASIKATGLSPAISGNGGKEYNKDKGTIVTITGNAVVSAANNYAIYHPDNGTLKIQSNATISGKGGIQMCSGTLNISGSPTITATCKADFTTGNSGPVYDNTSAITAINRSYPGGAPVVKISGTPTITAENDAEHAIYAFTWTKKSGEDGVTSDWEKAGENINISGGTYNKEFSTDYLANGYKLGDKDATTDNYTVEKKMVAQIGENQYPTLADAINAAEDGAEIKLIDDTTEGGIDITKSITIDFGNRKYTVVEPLVGSPGSVTNGLRFLKNGSTTNTVTLKNGTIESSVARILVQNYAHLTMESMTLDLSKQEKFGYVLSNNNGNTVLENCTITAPSAENSLAFDVCAFGTSYDDVSVTLKGDKSVINGNVGFSRDGNCTQNASLTLESGTINGSLVDNGKGETVTVTKSSTVTGLEAPTGYKWVDGEGGQTLTAVTYAATVTLADGTKTSYETIDEAKKALTDGATLTLLQNLNEQLTVPGCAGAVVIDLNDHTVTNSANGVAMYLNHYSEMSNKGMPCTVTVKNGKLVSANAAALRAIGNDNHLTKVVLENVELSAGEGKNPVDIQNTAYICYKDADEAKVIEWIGTGYVVEGTDENYAFGIERGFNAAIGMLPNGGTVNLLADYTGDKQLEYPKTTNSITLNLGGHTYTYTGSKTAVLDIQKPNVNLTIKNGTIIGNNVTYVVCGNYNKDVPALGSAHNLNLTLDGVTLKTTSGSGLGLNGMLTGDIKVTIKNKSVINAKNTGIYYPSVGMLTIEDSSITAANGVQICSGSMKITNTKITANGADNSASHGSDGTIDDGAAISIVNRDGYKGLGTIKIESGTFKAKSGVEAIKAYNWDGEKKDFTKSDDVNITGGTFSSIPENMDALCAAGYVPVKSGSNYTVAQGSYIAEVNGKQYGDLAMAFEAAQDGDTVKLLANIETTKSLTAKAVNAANVTFDLNGFSITGATLNANTPALAIVAANVNTLRSVTVTNSNNESKSVISAQFPIKFRSASGTDVKVEITGNLKLDVLEGGTNAIYLDNSAIYIPATDLSISFYKDGGFLVTDADGNDRIYQSVSGAQKAGKEIKLLNDTTAQKNSNPDATWGNFTLDLCGHSYYVAGNTHIFETASDGVTFTVKGGTLKSGKATPFSVLHSNTTLTIEDVTIETEADYAVATNGDDDGNNITLTNCTISAPYGTGVYFPSGGTLTINGGSITAKNGVQICGGSLKVTGAAITAMGDNDATNKTENDGPIDDGAAISIVERNGYKDLGTIVIESGTFTAAKGVAAITAYDWNDTAKKQNTFTSSNLVSVSGGIFSTEVPEDLCAEGFIPTTVEGGYGVVEGSYVAEIEGGKKFATLAEAVNAATDGQTVKLLEDANVETQIEVSKNITIDLNQQTVSGDAGIFFIPMNATVTIKNGSITPGSVKPTKDTALAGNAIKAWGTLTLNDVDITGTARYNSLLYMRKSATVTIDANSTITATDATNDYNPYPAILMQIDEEGSSKRLNVYGHVSAKVRPAIQGNGSDRGTSYINIYDGALVESEKVAMYLPQPCKVNITGGTVKGYCGIGIKSGTLNISGGTVQGTKDDIAIGDNNSQTNGISYDGSAILIDSYIGYAGQVKINISGDAVVESLYSTAIREIGNDATKTQLVELNVTGGKVLGDSKNAHSDKITSDILVRDVTAKTVSVSDGSFNHVVQPEYCAIGYEPKTEKDGDYFTVKKVSGNAYYEDETGLHYGYLGTLLDEDATVGKVITLLDTDKAIQYMGNLILDDNRTIDLAGNTLHVKKQFFVSNGCYVQDSTDGTGLLEVASENLHFISNNKQLPIYDSTKNAYRLFNFELWWQKEVSGTTAKVMFKPVFDNDAAYELLKSGNASNIKVTVTISWTSAKGPGSQEFEFEQKHVDDVANTKGGNVFYITLTGLDSDLTGKIKDIKAQGSFKSGTKTAVSSTEFSLS